MKFIKGVIFDWAGTTVDFGSTSPVSAFKEAFRRAGLDVTDEEVRAPMGLLKRDHIKTMLAMPRINQAWIDAHGKAPDADDAERIYSDFEPALMAVLDRHCDLLPEDFPRPCCQMQFNYNKMNEDGTPDTNWNTAIANENFRKSFGTTGKYPCK